MMKIKSKKEKTISEKPFIGLDVETPDGSQKGVS
jgi:hypothetical protein